MIVYHDEIEIEDFEYDEDDELYHYPCPCGDRFEITKDVLRKQETYNSSPARPSYRLPSDKKVQSPHDNSGLRETHGRPVVTTQNTILLATLLSSCSNGNIMITNKDYTICFGLSVKFTTGNHCNKTLIQLPLTRMRTLNPAITEDELKAGEEVATCPSCSLIVKVIYDKEKFLEEEEEESRSSKKETRIKAT
ncbi:Diphthamide biosynthesis protein 3 [Homalodisca vitripennis]|nr:Diphthamide biosynthesis protein 3 [Homalodisca vitripennis]